MNIINNLISKLEYFTEELLAIREELLTADPNSDWTRHLEEREVEVAFEVDLLESILTGKCLV